MKLAIMQPYFLPYLGYFDLLNRVDEWIVFDTPQYVKGSWINRNRILSENGDWNYLTVPVKRHHLHTPINEIKIADPNWLEKFFRQLDHYRKVAPYYQTVIALMKDCLSERHEHLYKINVLLFSKVASYLGIERPIHIFSEMNMVLQEKPMGKSDWCWAIAEKCKAKEYINRPGGAAFYKEEDFSKRGIKLTFQHFENMVYETGKYRKFKPGMSILDVMMWNSPSEIKQYLDTWRGLSSENPIFKTIDNQKTT